MRSAPAASTAIASASRGTPLRWRKAVGHIATVKAAIWKSSPEKVLGVAAALGRRANPEALAALLRALYRAAAWCADAGQPRRTGRAAGAARPMSDCPADWLHAGADRARSTRRRRRSSQVADFFVPHAKAATFPWKSHALWFYTQMVRWGQVGHRAEHEAIARDTYRPDLYRAALKPLGVALPGANAKVEGALRVRDAGRLGRRQPDAWTGRFLRRRGLRSGPSSMLTSTRPESGCDRECRQNCALHNFCALLASLHRFCHISPGEPRLAPNFCCIDFI